MKAIMLVSLCVCVLMGGCKAPSPIIEPNCPITVSTEQVGNMKKAIVVAATRLGWSAVDTGPTVVRCTLVKGIHEVKVDVVYTDKNFLIRYVDSKEMEYDPSMKTISRKYNQWVRNLEKEIRIQLSQFSL